MNTKATRGVILIRNGRVYDHDGDVDLPPIADLLIVDGVIAAVRPGIARALAQGEAVAELGARSIEQTIDASDKLVMPGFVNAHYHSHDVLLKGCFETIPLELWLLSALPPSYPKRSTAEIRARTLLGAFECLRSGMTTVQDLCTIYPYDEEHSRSDPQGLRRRGHPLRVRIAIRRHGGREIDSVLGRAGAAGAARVARRVGRTVPAASICRGSCARSPTSQRNRNPRLTFALGPTSPERCTPGIMTKLAELSDAEKLPVYTHVYELRAMTLIARQTHGSDDGSLIKYLKRVGLLTPRTNLAHSVWMTPAEIEAIAEAGTNVVLNPVGNLKTRSGIAPIRSYLKKGVARRARLRQLQLQRLPEHVPDHEAFCGTCGGQSAGARSADGGGRHPLGDHRRRANGRTGRADWRPASGHGRRSLHCRSHRSILRSAQ